MSDLCDQSLDLPLLLHLLERPKDEEEMGEEKGTQLFSSDA
jgi:hypothetical protein